jgi:lysophospholipid acyltransferase (LPLAT)-like uncharacterized protein
MSVKKKFADRIGLAVAPLLVKTVLGTIFRTCRKKVVGEEYLEELDRQGQPFIVASWHYGILYCMYLSPGRKWVGMVSASKDGDYSNRILGSIGIKGIRGSKTTGSISALKGIIKAVKKEGYNSYLTADGSQGPPRLAQAGVILLASRTGAPIVPLTCGADRYVKFKSWDRTILPKPFSRLLIKWGEPLVIPAGVKSDAMEEYRLELEKRLNDDYTEVWSDFDREDH